MAAAATDRHSCPLAGCNAIALAPSLRCLACFLMLAWTDAMGEWPGLHESNTRGKGPLPAIGASPTTSPHSCRISSPAFSVAADELAEINAEANELVPEDQRVFYCATLSLSSAIGTAGALDVGPHGRWVRG